MSTLFNRPGKDAECVLRRDCQWERLPDTSIYRGMECYTERCWCGEVRMVRVEEGEA